MNDAGAPTAGGSLPRAVLLPLGLILFGGAGLVALHNWLGLGGAALDWVADGRLGAAVVAAAGVACLLRAVTVRRERGAWLLIGAGVFAWAGGEAYWAWFIVGDPEAPYPSPADALYLAYYPFVYAGLALLVRAKTRELNWRLWTDGAIAALGTAALGAVFVIDFVAEQAVGTTAEVAISLAYPLADIALLALIVGVVALSDWRPDRTWSLLLAGLSALVVADIAYSIQSSGGVVPLGNWIDPVYLLSACFVGAVAWLPGTAAIAPGAATGNRRVLMVPIVVAVPMIGLAAMQYVAGPSALSTLLWMVTIAAIVGRLAVSVHENGRLLEQVQTDTLTGLGSRGCLEADLPDLLARADEDRPVLVLLFDLNGFKHYNDTFGHPAGDELLRRFGERLRAGIGDDGSAYRIGGDELCVVLTCPPQRFDAATREAAKALCAVGPGFDVSASWGGAEAPREETEASAILQLADVRMYAQKESRRAAHDGRGPVSVPAWPQPTSGAT
jgi:diguanylate cyclase (GGDEF)-like protein